MRQPTQDTTVKKLQGGIESVPMDSTFVLSVMKITFLMLIPKNEISSKLVDHFSEFFRFMYDIITIPTSY